MENEYIVSARKYRPQTFESVVGQQTLTETLQNAIRTLSEFQQEGLVAVEGRHIQICNLKELEHISHLG